MAVLTLTTDFGTSDWYVAAMKGVVLTSADPARDTLQLVDVSHEVPPGDIATAAFLLSAAAPNFPAGTVHLAPPGRAAVLTGSPGTLELSLDGSHLADAWGVATGARVTVRRRSVSTNMSTTGGDRALAGRRRET